ncbi:L-sorbose 1-dehydrogenase [Sarcoptes scabiei]|uniref:L-sorbose 1-dehydrogenase n=1 Tax=Sarcoptes scabiei TaxID=52283 RepID=A0A834VE57_SARSC|nr:L-sorbose 1-dehydrogenase [Sarcoptes scabiei]
MDWKILSVPQNNSCLAMNNRRCHLASGRVIGGTSSINRMYYLRGNPKDFDEWESKYGLKSWSWKDIFPLMMRNENQEDPERAKTGHYGLKGPLTLGQIESIDDRNSSDHKLMASFLLASKHFGYRNQDPNTGAYNTSSLLQSTIKQGKRQSSSTVFLEPFVKNRPNLHILTNSLVVKILFENDQQAIGVQFYRDWKQYSVFARQEILIAAGALNSPKLLMLSGIGPQRELNRLKIPIVSDLMVGENLHDHVGSLGLYFIANDLLQAGITKQQLKQYFYRGKGPLSESPFAATMIKSNRNLMNNFQTSSSSSSPSSSGTDSMLLMHVNGLTSRELSAELTEQQINLKRSVWKDYFGEKLRATIGKQQFTILPIVLKPKSRGSVRLKSNNPFDMALVDPNYFGDPNDLEQIVSTMREALKIVRSDPFTRFRTEWYRHPVPGCEYEFKRFESEIDSQTMNEYVSEFDNFITSADNFYEKSVTPTELPEKQLENESSIKVLKHKNFVRDPSTINQVHSSPSSSFHFVSSLVSRLLKKSLFKKNFEEFSRRQSRSQKMNRINFEHYWLGQTNQSLSNQLESLSHPLINKTLYGGLIDGFSSNDPNDQSVITVWSSHGTNQKSRSKPSESEKLSEKPRTNSITSTTTESIYDLLTDVSPIVLTGYIQSPPYDFQSPSSIQSSELRNKSRISSQNGMDQYLRCMARMLTMPIGDYVGTCKMGPPQDVDRVVDERFRVIGTKSLRVIDNSVVPEITTGSLAPVALMLGERGAEFIKEDRRKRVRRSS